MSDLTKKSNMFYLAFFLLAVCGVAAGVMAVVAAVTEKPIEANKMKKTLSGLKIVLEGIEYDNDPSAEKVVVKADDNSDVTIYTARLKGVPAAYAVTASTKLGYGGVVEGLAGFDSDGKILKYIITDSNETPGIGTKVTDRVARRTLTDVLSGKKAVDSLPPNKTLDSFEGKRAAPGDAKWGKSSGLSFVTGATVSSNAVTDLAWNAAKALSARLEQTRKVTEE